MVRLRLRRIAAGLTQFDLSQRTGIPQGRVSLLERGLIAPSVEEREVIGAIFGVEAAVLFAKVDPATV